MPPTQSETSPIFGADRGGMDRRTMIKVAAAAGAGAWAAPMIVDSLASPAAAASGGLVAGAYLYYFQVNWTTNGCSVTLLDPSVQGNFSNPTPPGGNVTGCNPGARVVCGQPGDVAVTALFEGTNTPVDGCGATAACPAGAGTPVGPNQGLCFSFSGGTIVGFDTSPVLNSALDPSGLNGGYGYGCLTTACNTGGVRAYNASNNNLSGTTSIVAIKVTVP